MNDNPVFASQTPDAAIEHYLLLSQRIPGWTRGEEAAALARASFSMPGGAVIVEIGSFFGCGTVLLAGAQKLRGSGRVHCIDPFDGSGDVVSVRHYQPILLAFAGCSQRAHFDTNIESAGLADWVEVHEGLAHDVAADWNTPIDMLFMDGDQSPAGARLAYDRWSPWLVRGGLIALHNSNDRDYEDGHQGHRLLVTEEVMPPAYRDVYCVGSTTFARKHTTD
jgi:hypothetical protein